MGIDEIALTWWPVAIIGVFGAVYLAVARCAIAEIVVRLAARLYGSDSEERARWTEEWLRHVEELNPSERPAQAGSLLWAGIRVSVVRLPKRHVRADVAAATDELVGLRGWGISPYVRRLRLAAELRALRTEGGLTHQQLAKQIGQSRAQISRLENGYVVDQDDVLRILNALGVDPERWTQIMTIAREASQRGWWESNKAMGDRQAFYANVEAGAATIREFQMCYLPGLLQIPAYTRARIETTRPGNLTSWTAEKAIEGRQNRQWVLRRPGGPTYDVIIDEVVIRRPAAPAEIVKAQLRHIVHLAKTDPSIRVRILPIDARIEGFALPRSAYSIYTYPDPGDPTVVAVDTVTDDLILVENSEVNTYEILHQRLTDAALSIADTLSFLIAAAKRL